MTDWILELLPMRQFRLRLKDESQRLASILSWEIS